MSLNDLRECFKKYLRDERLVVHEEATLGLFVHPKVRGTEEVNLRHCMIASSMT